jgi:hypothetical protein
MKLTLTPTIKKSVFIMVVSILLLNNGLKAQHYQLIPDSCTYCIFQSKIGSNWYNDYYSISPTNDTIINNNTYIKVEYIQSRQLLIRQDGNKILGFKSDSIHERVIMDFDAQIGDTLNYLYSLQTGPNNGFNYNAVVINKDSVLLGDGSYNTYLDLEGFYMIAPGIGEIYFNWNFTWYEKGLCSCNLGGYLNNTPVDFNVLDGPFFVNVSHCTSDTLIPQICYHYGHTCQNCTPILSEIVESWNSFLQLFPNPTQNEFFISLENSNEPNLPFKIVDISGKEVLQSFANTNTAIDISNLPNGYYFVQVQIGEQYVSKSLIVSK